MEAVSQDVAPAYGRGALGVIFVSAVLGFAMDGYNLYIITFLAPFIGATLHVSGVEMGSVLSAQLIASMVGGIGFGWLGDAIGRKRTLMAAILTYSVGALLSGLSWNYGSLLAFRFVTGLGLGGEWGAGMVLFNEAWSPARRGLGSGMIQSSFLAGQSLAGLVVAAVISAVGPMGWHLAMMTGMVPAVLIIFIRIWMPESKVWESYDRMRREDRLPPEKREERSALVEIFRHRLSVRYLVLGLLLVGGYMFALVGVASFMPTLLITHYHANVGVVGGITGTVLWIAIPFYILFGGISDYWGRQKAFVIPALLWIAGAVGLYFATRSTAPYPGSYWSWSVFDAYLVMYVGTSAGGWFGPWLAEIFPVEVRNTATSVAYMVGRGASAIATMIVPLFGIAGLANGMALVGILGSVVMFVFGMWLPDARGRVFHAIEDVYVAGGG